MTGKISDDAAADPTFAVTDATHFAAEAGLVNKGPSGLAIATYVFAKIGALTNKTINAASNTISNLTTAMFAANVVDTDGTLAANSDTRIATQKAVKTYADQLIAANDAMVFKGVIDCSGNPNYPAADRGWTYKVSVAGKIGGASGLNVEVSDQLLCITDATASGNQATVGANWTVIQANIDGAVTGPASSTSGNLPTFNGASGKIVQDSGVAISTDGTFAANSDAKVPTEKAVKAYVTGAAPGVNAASRAGSFDVWQRLVNGASTIAIAASTTAYANDGWYLATGANQACTITQVSGIASGSRYAAKVQRNSGQAGTGVLRYAMPLDTDEIAPLLGSYVTLSFTVKEGANHSFSHAVSAAVYCGTGAVGKRSSSAYTGETAVISQAFTTSTSAGRVQVTSSVVVPANTTQLEIQISVTPSGTAGADDSFTIDDLQLEVVSSATAVASNFAKIPYAQQLALCQRFLPVYDALSGSNRYIAFGGAFQTTRSYVLFAFMVPTRVPVTGVTASAVGHFLTTDGSASGLTATAIAFSSATLSGAILFIDVASGLTVGQASAMGSQNVAAQLLFTGGEI